METWGSVIFKGSAGIRLMKKYRVNMPAMAMEKTEKKKGFSCK